MASLDADQKKKLGILAAFLGVLVVVGYFALGGGGSNNAETPLANAAPTTAAAGATTTASTTGAPKTETPEKSPFGKSEQKPEEKPKAPPPAAKPVLAKAALIKNPVEEPLKGSRPDPFEPFFYATPEPTATPTPLPPPVELPPPPQAVPLPSPRMASAPPNTALIGLARPRIARYTALPGPVFMGRSGGLPQPPRTADTVIRSPNKRLSGVVIGDAVRALLEISTGETTTGQPGGTTGEGGVGAAAPTTIVRVVQPGDEVDGIKILRIERVLENGKQITRMFVREGTEERFIDLRPSPNPPAAAGTGGTGEGGSGSSPGGSPFGSIRPTPGGGFPRPGGITANPRFN